MQDLVISETFVRRDDEGRYCLNDLHRAAGGAKHHQPAKFFANKSTRAMVRLLREGASPNSETPPVATVNDGHNNGTFVVKELVYAYAMWISPEFSLKVIRTYDAMVQSELDKLNALSVRRARADLEYLEAVAEASRCGLGLRRWRDTRPALEARIQALKDESQPGLFLN